MKIGGKIFLLLCFLGTSTVFFVSCERIYSTPEENIELPKKVASITEAILSITEMVEHINSTNSTQDIQKNVFNALEKEIGCSLNILDSITTDGDGYEYTAEFTGLKSRFDRKRRIGKFTVSLSKNYREIGASSIVSVAPNDPFQILSLDDSLTNVFGDISFTRTNLNQVKIEYSHLSVIQNKKNYSVDGNYTMSWTSGAETDGLIWDEVKISGNGNFLIDNTEESNWDIILPLEKNYEYGCSENLIKGILEINRVGERFKVDFDPFENKSCNNIVKIYYAGKEFEVRIY